LYVVGEQRVQTIERFGDEGRIAAFANIIDNHSMMYILSIAHGESLAVQECALQQPRNFDQSNGTKSMRNTWPFTAVYISSRIGLYTTPSTGTPPMVNPMLTATNGYPCTKLVVPSRGSTNHVGVEGGSCNYATKIAKGKPMGCGVVRHATKSRGFRHLAGCVRAFRSKRRLLTHKFIAGKAGLQFREHQIFTGLVRFRDQINARFHGDCGAPHAATFMGGFDERARFPCSLHGSSELFLCTTTQR
jgi:hypothetical protein